MKMIQYFEDKSDERFHVSLEGKDRMELIIESEQELNLIMDAAKAYVDKHPDLAYQREIFSESCRPIVEKITVEEITNTCEACPSQWEGKTTAGERIYIRYRWGYLVVRVNGKCIYEESVGDNWDGCMSFDELKQHTSNIINWTF